MIWLFIIILIFYCIKPLLKSKILNTLTNTEYVIVIGAFFAISSLIYTIYKMFIKKEETNIVSKLFSDYKILLFIIIITSFKYFVIDRELIYLQDVGFSKFVPQFKSISILAAFIVGVFILGESRKFKDYIAFCLILVGFILFGLK